MNAMCKTKLNFEWVIGWASGEGEFKLLSNPGMDIICDKIE